MLPNQKGLIESMCSNIHFKVWSIVLLIRAAVLAIGQFTIKKQISILKLNFNHGAYHSMPATINVLLWYANQWTS